MASLPYRHFKAFGGPMAPSAFIITTITHEIERVYGDKPGIYKVQQLSTGILNQVPFQRKDIEKEGEKVNVRGWDPYALAINLKEYLKLLQPRLIYGSAIGGVIQGAQTNNLKQVKEGLGELDQVHQVGVKTLVNHWHEMKERMYTNAEEVAQYFQDVVFEEGTNYEPDRVAAIAYLIENASQLFE